MSSRTDRVILSPLVVPIHYDLSITPVFVEPFVYSATVVIHLDLRSDSLTSLTFHSKELTVTSCSFTSHRNAVLALKSTNISYDTKLTTVTFEFDKTLPDGECFVEITFTGTHNNVMAGFYRSNYTAVNGSKQIMLSTQFEPLDARRCFVCVDEPARKATFSVILTIPSHLTAISNTPVLSTETEPNNLLKITFEKSPKMSTYLLAVCIGEFSFIQRHIFDNNSKALTQEEKDNNVLIKVYSTGSKQKQSEFALDVAVDCLKLYNSCFGVKFPLKKLDMIAIPEFAAGAMENWGLVTYREVDLLFDAETGSNAQKQRVCEVVCHELAHQWFGNLVTMNWWEDLWLNEGFASFMQNYATEKLFPNWLMWEQFVAIQLNQALTLDSLLSSHPIQVPIKHAEEVEQVFDIISYRKGACVVRLVYELLGENNFFDGIKLYMLNYQYKNTETIDLWNSWSKVSKLNISELMSSWTEIMGYPLLTISEKVNNKNMIKFEISQSWFLQDGTKNSAEKVWSVPINLLINNKVEKLGILSEKKKTFEVSFDGKKVDKKDIVFKLNVGQSVPIRVNYSEANWLKLCELIKKDKVDIKDKVGLVLDAFALTKSGDLKPEILLNIIASCKNESDYSVWLTISSALNNLDKVLTEDMEFKGLLNSIGKTMTLSLFNKIENSDKKDVENHLSSLLKSLCYELLVTFCENEPEIVQKCAEMFENYTDNILADKFEAAAKSLPSSIRCSVFRIVLANSEKREKFDKLLKTLDKLETIAERKEIYNSLGFIKSEELKIETLDFAINGPQSGKVKLQDFFYVIYSVAVSSLTGTELAWDYFKKNSENILNMVKNANPSLLAAVVSYSVVNFVSKEKAKEVEEFFEKDKEKWEKVERKVKQTVEAMMNNANFREKLIKDAGFKNVLVQLSKQI